MKTSTELAREIVLTVGGVGVEVTEQHIVDVEALIAVRDAEHEDNQRAAVKDAYFRGTRGQ